MTGELLVRLLNAVQASKVSVKERGDVTVEAVVQDIIANKEVWPAVKDVLAVERLTTIVQARVRPTVQMEEPPLIAGFEALGGRVAFSGKERFVLAEASPEKVHAYREWFEKRHAGTLNRSEREELRLKQIQELDDIHQKVAKDHPGIPAAEAVALHQVAEQRRKQEASDRRRRRVKAAGKK